MGFVQKTEAELESPCLSHRNQHSVKHKESKWDLSKSIRSKKDEIDLFLSSRRREMNLQAAGNHAVDGVVTATADTNDLNLRGLHRGEGASQPQRLGL